MMKDGNKNNTRNIARFGKIHFHTSVRDDNWA